MNIKKCFLAATLALACVLFAGSAFANEYYPTDIVSLSDLMSGSGATKVSASSIPDSYVYQVSSLAFQTYIPTLVDKFRNASGTALYTNLNTAIEHNTFTPMSLDGAYFTSQGTYNGDAVNKTYQLDSSHVQIYKIGSSGWTYNGLIFSAGSLIIGLNDDPNQTCGGDFDDFIMVAAKCTPSPTPIPGAVWLLGSGLMGLMGFKRSSKHRLAA